VGRFVLSESELQRHSVCPLFDGVEVHPMEQPAEQTFRWALRERHSGVIRPVTDLRARFVEIWAKAWGAAAKTSEYWKGPNMARSYGRRLYEFLLNLEVIHPFQPYELKLGAGLVRGENALVLCRPARQEPYQLVVNTYLRRPQPDVLRVPNYRGLAQWLAARDQSESVDIGIVNMPLIYGDRWTVRNVDEALARTWINAIVKTAAENLMFPRAGKQCETCSQPCKKVTSGQNDHRWR
jgi:hypothetical protein